MLLIAGENQAMACPFCLRLDHRFQAARQGTPGEGHRSLLGGGVILVRSRKDLQAFPGLGIP